jgi:hypothetical protein
MTKANESGLDVDITLDDVSYSLPNLFDPAHTLRQSIQEDSSGMFRVDAAYDGGNAGGLPDQPDRYEWALDYNLDDNYATTIAAFEELRTAGGIHTFAYWKKKKYRYTARSAQQVFYLSRQDAYAKGYAGHNAAGDAAVITVNNGAPTTIDYGPGEITSASVVASGHVAISTVPVQHPNSGKWCALFKFGDALNQFDLVRVEYYPLFNVAVRELVDRPFQLVGREDKTLHLVECA